MKKIVTAGDGIKIVAAVEAIYHAATDPLSWPDALQAIADCFDDVGGVLLWQRDDGSFGSIASAGLAAAQQDYQARGWHMRDTRSIRAVERNLWLGDDAVTERHFISESEMEIDPFYNDFLHCHGLRWCAGVGIAPDPHISVGLSVQRLARKPPYSDEELALVTTLGRHTEKALRMSMRMLDAELNNVGLGDALARVGIGVFALDRVGRVVFSNPAAQRLIGGNVDVVDGRLNVGSGAERAEIRAKIKQMLSGEPAAVVADPKPILIRRSPNDRPLIAYLLPIASRERVIEKFLTHTRAIVLVIEPKDDDPPDPAVVRDLLGLTLGEARVASMIGFGLAPREAASRLGITEESVRTVLKRVFAKTEISRQSELSAMLTKLVLR